MTKQGIYIIERVEDRERMSRFVVVADSAAAAVERVAGHEGVEPADLDVGRLGDFDPGNDGAAMARGSYVAIQRIGPR